MSVSTSLAIVGSILALAVGYLIGTSPAGVTPPVAVTKGLVPPWPIFRAVVGAGDMLAGLATATKVPEVAMIDVSMSYMTASTAYTFAKLDLADYMVDKEVDCTALAKAAGNLNEDMLCRFLSTAEAVGLVKQTAGKWGTTPLGQVLETNHPLSKKAFVIMINESHRWAWDKLPEVIKTGKSGVSLITGGDEVWKWFAEKVPDQHEVFDAAMKDLTEGIAMAVLQDVDFSQTKCVCDIGGGIGALAAAVLQHYPAAQGKVLDLGETIGRDMQRLGLQERSESITASFFEPLPPSINECDTYIMKHILHDWSDEDGVKILRNVAATMADGDRIIVVEFVRGTAGAGMEYSKALMDMTMMAVCPPGAKERTITEYEKLFNASGLRLAQHAPLRSLAHALVVQKA